MYNLVAFDFAADSKSLDLRSRTMWRLLLFLLFSALRSTHCFSGRIIGGHDATINEYPYQVSIHYKGELTCGGSIIRQSWVLTAAHCVFGMNPAYFQIRLRSSYSGKNGVLIGGVRRTIWHSLFNHKTFNYDVSLILLPTPINVSATSRPIGLAEPTAVVQAGKNAVVTGWGRLTPKGDMSGWLQALAVPVVDQNVCKKIFPRIRSDITDNMMCAGSLAGGKDTCRGDSGGSLVYDGVQIGIVSWGYGCAKPKFPGVYTRVSAVRNWIREKTNA